MFIKKIQEILKNNKEINEIREENKKSEDIIIEARKEISWLKMILTMNRYGSPENILSMTLRKVEEIEEILEK